MQRHVSVAAIEAIREMPIPVILATGNVACFVRAAAKLLGASDSIIAENGGVVQVGYDAKEIVLADIEECRRASEFLQEHLPGMESLDARYRRSEMAFRRNIDLEKARSLLREKYPGLELVDTRFALHLKHRNVNKGTGILKIADILGLEPEGFAAMGDSENDLHMFKAAALGIAVGNAVPEVKAAASYVTKASYGEGAAEGLRWLRDRL